MTEEGAIQFLVGVISIQLLLRSNAASLYCYQLMGVKIGYSSIELYFADVPGLAIYEQKNRSIRVWQMISE